MNKPNGKKTITHYTTMEQQRALTKATNLQAVMLYQFMLTKIGLPNYEYTDAKSALALGWSEQSVKRARLSLIKAGWFFVRKWPAVDGVKHHSYYFGPNVVSKTTRDNMDTDTFIEEEK